MSEDCCAACSLTALVRSLQARREGVVACICNADILNAVGCICHADERRAMVRAEEADTRAQHD